MSDSNPVEIAAKAVGSTNITGRHFSDQYCHSVARVVIAALEREGFKLMRREPTKEMSITGEEAVRNTIDGCIDSRTDQYEIYQQPDVWAATGFQAMFDAAPSYATPVETAESGR